MSGPRRANWRTEAAALVASESELRIAERELFRQRLTSIEASLLRRIEKLENRKRIESWVTVVYMVGLAIWWAVTR